MIIHCASFAILIVIIYIYILSLSFVFTQNTEYDGCLVLGRGFLAQNYITTNQSFALQTPLRAISSLDAPLYSKIVNLVYYGGSDISVILTLITKILVEEVIGYRVLLDDNASKNPPTFVNSFTVPATNCLPGTDGLGDFAISTGDSASNNNYKAEYQSLVPSIVTNLGALSIQSIGSFYIGHEILQQFPQYTLNFWASYTPGTRFYPNFPDLFFPYSDARAEFVRNVVNVTRVNAWNFVATIFPQFESDIFLGPSCPPDNIYTLESGGLYAGCNDASFPNMFCPSSCFPNPKEQCTVWITYPPLLGGSQHASLIQHLNMSVCIAYVDYEYFLNPSVWTDTFYPGMVIASANDLPIGETLCAGGVSCYQTVTLPRFDEICNQYFNGSVTSPFLCGEPPNTFYKLARNELKESAPRIWYFIQQFDFNSIQGMQLNQYDCVSGDDRCRAVQWIQNNQNVWMKWIAPPAACVDTDYGVQLSGCDETRSLQVATYFWRQPKACQGGVALPDAESFSCGYYSSSNHQVFPATITIASVLLFIILFYHISVHTLVGLLQKMQDKTWFSGLYNRKLLEWMWCSGHVFLYLNLLLLISTPRDSNALCAVSVAFWWIATQIIFLSLINQGVWKLASKVGNFSILLGNWKYYMANVHSPLCGTAGLVFYLINSNSLLSVGTFSLTGGHSANFVYCNLPSVWTQWCTFLFLLCSWIPLLCLWISVYIFDLYPMFKLQREKQQKEEREAQKQNHHSELSSSKTGEADPVTLFLLVYKRLSLLVITVLVAQIVVLYSLFANDVYTSPNHLQNQLVIWVTVVLLLMFFVLNIQFSYSKSFFIIFKSLSVLFISGKKKWITNQNKAIQGHNKNSSPSPDNRIHPHVTITVEEALPSVAEKNNLNKTSKRSALVNNNKEEAKRLFREKARIPADLEKYVDEVYKELRQKTDFALYPQSWPKLYQLHVEILEKNSDFKVNAGDNTPAVFSEPTMDYLSSPVAFCANLPFGDVETKLLETSYESSVSSKSSQKGGRDHHRHLNSTSQPLDENSDQEHSSNNNNSSKPFALLQEEHFKNLPEIMADPIKLRYFLEWSAQPLVAVNDSVRFLMEMKRLHYVLFHVINLNSTEIVENVEAIMKFYIGKTAQVEINISESDANDTVSSINAQFNVMLSNQTKVITLESRLKVWLCFSTAIKNAVNLMKDNNCVKNFAKHKLASKCIEKLQQIDSLFTQTDLSEAIAQKALLLASHYPNNDEGLDTTYDSKLLNQLIETKQRLARS